MAEEGEQNAGGAGATEDDSSQAGGGKKPIVLVLLGLLLVGLSVGGTLLATQLLGGESAEVDVAGEAGAEAGEAPPEPVKPAIYYPLKPPIMVSFEARGRQRLLQAEVTLLTRDNDVIAAVEMHMPMLRNALVLLMGGQTYEEIQTAEGKELLRVQCLQELQRLLEKEIGKPGIEQVLFTSLILQ